MEIDRLEASLLSRLFSTRVLRELGRDGRSAFFAGVISQTQLVKRLERSESVGGVFDQAFRLLKRSNFRDDYVFRSAVVQKILLGRHSLKTATLLSEFRANGAKADLVVLNGTSTVYEIKSDRDSLARLGNQIANYLTVFSAVNVVIGEAHLARVVNFVPENVGIIILSQRFSLRTYRVARSEPARIDPIRVVDSLRFDEASAILTSLGIRIPQIANTKFRAYLRDEFGRLDPTLVHDQMVNNLRRGRSQRNMSEFVQTVPDSLKSATLALGPNAGSQTRLTQTLKLPLADALLWS